jgi:hypothetical protein
VTFLWFREGGCRGAFLLLPLTTRGRICARCYLRLGEPTAAPVDRDEAERRRQEVARRMLGRGGQAAYLVKSGKAGL